MCILSSQKTVCIILLPILTLAFAQDPVKNTLNTSELLNFINGISTYCSTSNPFPVAMFDFDVSGFEDVQQKTDLLSSIIRDQQPNRMLYLSMAKEMLILDRSVHEVRIIQLDSNQKTNLSLRVKRNLSKYKISYDTISLDKDVPWFSKESRKSQSRVTNLISHQNYSSSIRKIRMGSWSYPYRDCSSAKWLISYTVPIKTNLQAARGFRTVFSLDIDISNFDLDQCNDSNDVEMFEKSSPYVIKYFRGSHKCNVTSSKCKFVPGNGWLLGSYQCVCKKGYYSTLGLLAINGTVMEAAHSDKLLLSSVKFDALYAFKKCQPGCFECQDDAPCLSAYNWMFRIALLTICIICIILTFLLIAYVYSYRKLKIIKVSSPIFLYITLIGAIIMYSEMAAIFPVLDMYSCIATKWTRHLGFCITYSALLLKTWRVSLTYRVKSAHKLKLTDKQLLQWLFPILLVIVIYLSTWTLSTPPRAIYLEDWYNLKFKQCEYGWWDHSLAIGEVLFLLWGIKVCYNVRNAESFFNEAKYISWAIYNIAVVNFVMVGIHLVFLPDATPDMKYLFGFVRTQLSTTITVILVFGPKFYRVIKGQGDTWENCSKVTGVTASFSLNGVGLMHEDTTDLYQENEELKEEIQKLAAQMEFMKIVHMEMNNRHLKPKHGSVFSQSGTNQSSTVKATTIYTKFDTSDSPSSRISPAAELISERV